MYFKIELIDIKAKKDKVSREEKNDIKKYIENARVEAENKKKALRSFANMVNGRLGRDGEGDNAVITLPDYGNCQIIIDVAEVM